MDYAMIPTTPEHIAYVAQRMRGADVAEVFASSGMAPEMALEMSVRLSDPCYTGMAGDEPICIFGVAPVSMLSSVGVPWLLGTDAVAKHSRAFLRRNRKMIQGWMERFDLLENYVDVRNTKSIQWLRWCGFTIHDPQPHGAFGLPFHHFEMRRS